MYNISGLGFGAGAAEENFDLGNKDILFKLRNILRYNFYQALSLCTKLTTSESDRPAS